MLGWLPLSYSVHKYSVDEEAIIFITSQGPLIQCPTSANCTKSCQQTTEGESLYLRTIHLFMRSEQNGRNCRRSTDQQYFFRPYQSSSIVSINFLHRQNDKLCRWERDIRVFEGHNRNEMEYEMHQVKWWYTCTVMLAAAKGVHLDAGWHLQTPAWLFYGCLAAFPPPATWSRDYSFSTIPVVVNISIIFLRPLRRFQSRSSHSPSILASRGRSLLSSPTSDCSGWWRNMEFLYSSKFPSRFTETEWYNRAHRSYCDSMDSPLVCAFSKLSFAGL